jgi:Outer membrane protein beta-barrel domain
MSLIRIRRTAFAAIALVITVSTASTSALAQYEPNFELSVQGGYDRTLSALKDVAEDGFGAGASLGYRFSDRLVIGGDFQFHNYNINELLTSGFQTPIDVSMRMVEYAGFAKLYLNDSDQRLYVRGSAGLFAGRTAINFLGNQAVATTTDPGVSGAIGFQLFGQRNSATFFEASYRRLIGEDVHWVGFSVGASFFVW